MTVLFIADLHLQPQRPEITRALTHFLETRARHADALYVLGDLFEAWIGDDATTEFEQSVASAFHRTAQAGCRLFFQHGNRDFLLGEAFARRCGFNLLPEAATIALDDQPVLLMHGDSLCLEDTAYQAFRQQVRDPHWQQAFLSKPIAERVAVARQVREASQAANREKAEAIMDVSPREVERVMNQHGVRTLIHGHTHRPAAHSLTVGGHAAQRLVLGDWDAFGWALTWQQKTGFALERFALSGD